MNASPLACLVLGAATSLVTTALARAAAVRTGLVARPNPIVPQHTAPVAYLGGLGLAGGVAYALAILHDAGAVPELLASPGARGGLAGSVAFLALGLADDVRPFTPGPKLALQALAAAVAVGLGWAAPLTGHPALDAAASVLWVLVLVNATNFTDVCDGLVGGLGAVTALAFGLLGLAGGPLPFVIAGACLGFLVFNAPPARIYLGDAGSHLLGFLLAVGTLDVATRGVVAAWPAAALLAGVPLFELVFITGVRVGKGLPWWRGSPDHFSLRAQAAGLGRWRTNALAWTAAATLAGVAWSLLHLPAWGGAVVLAWVALAAGAIARWLLRHDPRSVARHAAAGGGR